MQKIDFIKMHGLGNDFVIIDKRFKKIDISNTNFVKKIYPLAKNFKIINEDILKSNFSNIKNKKLGLTTFTKK